MMSGAWVLDERWKALRRHNTSVFEQLLARIKLLNAIALSTRYLVQGKRYQNIGLRGPKCSMAAIGNYDKLPTADCVGHRSSLRRNG